ncbi:DUF4168 domain-containing protein [Microbulbifer halophilus]|uniref:DUF4168 domain-containing protein n=1 Tax=Microbulbifer halophilus TaxID=453963 RepID=A0ABW5EAK0_9GAMM|nr:DUF4168 domain-containing protein [Microbulbifer halophilus]MCW8126878.1 DUF4168 domain-containing protein [Microbulbifer halophilus]
MIKWTQPLTAFLLALAVSTGAGAQSDATDSGAKQAYKPAKAIAATDFSDSELKIFAEVQAEVEQMRTTLQGKLSGTQDPETARKVRMEANEEMVSAVQSSDLSPKRYNQIARAALNDPELAEKIQQME